MNLECFTVLAIISVPGHLKRNDKVYLDQKIAQHTGPRTENFGPERRAEKIRAKNLIIPKSHNLFKNPHRGSLRIKLGRSGELLSKSGLLNETLWAMSEDFGPRFEPVSNQLIFVIV